MKQNSKIEAIYARQSVDRKDSISIESQVEQCEKELIGENSRVYCDRGYSGKNTDRPEFQRMIRDVESGVISRVIVFKLDRISRSVLDFAEMIDVFRKHKVDFVSTAEKFDTSTPVGNAMLMLVMIFAQLERETIQQRVIDAYAARSKRGFYMGGPIPFGFKAEETVIDGIHTKKYVPDGENAEIVKAVFTLYSDPGVSLGDVVRYLDGIGIRNRDGHPLNRNRVREIIVNPAYVKADSSVYGFFKEHGTNIVDPLEDFTGVNGAYLYSGDEEKRKHLNLQGHTLVLAPHEGIVDPQTWLRCREKCMGNKSVARSCKAKTTWLAGKIRCGLCGYALAAKTSRRKKGPDKRYFLCTERLKSLPCSLGALDADAVEKAVLAEITKKLAAFATLSGGNACAVNEKELELEAKIEKIEAEISEFVSKIPGAEGATMDYINRRVNGLDREKKDLAAALEAYRAKKNDRRTEVISGYMAHWDELTMSDKISVVDVLIESVSATKEKIEIRWKI